MAGSAKVRLAPPRSGSIATPSRDVARLVEIVARLPAPAARGISSRPSPPSLLYTIEEAYEVAEAISRGDRPTSARWAISCCRWCSTPAWARRKALRFRLGGQAITAKMVRRHPHVFGDDDTRDVAVAQDAWARIKAEEKTIPRRPPRRRGQRLEPPGGLLDGVAVGLPALTREVRLQARPARSLRLERSARGDRQDPRGARRIEAEIVTPSPVRARQSDGWATLSSPSPISPTISISIRRRRCAAPTTSSAAASPISRPASPPRAARPPGSARRMEALWVEAKGMRWLNTGEPYQQRRSEV